MVERRKGILRYSRSEMLGYRSACYSRPKKLPKGFDTAEGLFSPDEWIQHIWKSEGVESRSVTRKKVPINAKSLMENTSNPSVGDPLGTAVLSPQRRGFSSGCRAPAGIEEEKHNERKVRWRHNQSASHVDFKPAFQKNALDLARSQSSSNNSGSNSLWRGNGGASFNQQENRPWADKNNKGRTHFQDEKAERIPEWVNEGPSSMTDIIELKGFEEDEVKEKRSRKKVRNRESPRTVGAASKTEKKNSSRASSANFKGTTLEEIEAEVMQAHSDAIKNADEGVASTDSVQQTTSDSSLKNLFPNSDAEFAAYMGILDASEITSSDTKTVDLSAELSSENSLGASRLSRFFSNSVTISKPVEVQNPINLDGQNSSKGLMEELFKKQYQLQNKTLADANQQQLRAIIGNQNADTVKQERDVSGLGTGGLPPMLKKIFANSNSSLFNDQRSVEGNSISGLTVEELEREMASKNRRKDLVSQLTNNLIGSQQQQQQQQASSQHPVNQQQYPIFGNPSGSLNKEFKGQSSYYGMISANQQQSLLQMQQNVLPPQQQHSSVQSNPKLLHKIFANSDFQKLASMNLIGSKTVTELERDISLGGLGSSTAVEENIPKYNEFQTIQAMGPYATCMGTFFGEAGRAIDTYLNNLAIREADLQSIHVSEAAAAIHMQFQDFLVSHSVYVLSKQPGSDPQDRFQIRTMVERVVQHDPTLLITFMRVRQNSLANSSGNSFGTQQTGYPPQAILPKQVGGRGFDFGSSSGGLQFRSLHHHQPPIQSVHQTQQRSGTATPTSFSSHSANNFMPTSVLRQMYLRDP